MKSIFFRGTLLFIILGGFLWGDEADAVKEQFDSAISVVKSQEYSEEAIKNINDLIDSVFRWKINENQNGYILTIDHPYPDFLNPHDFASLTVLKQKGNDRLYLISFAFGRNVDPEKEISLFFGKYTADELKKIDMSPQSFESIPFDKVAPDYIKVTFPEFYVGNDKSKDLLDAMSRNDFMFISLSGMKGEKYRIGIALTFFKDAIKNLK